MIKSLIEKVSRYMHLLFLIALFPVTSFAQVKDTTATTETTTTVSPVVTTTTVKQKGMHGMFYITWGYNRDAYTKSTINFKDMTTDDYDFTLHKAYAHDQPDFHDLLHSPISVPQYQLNVGYMFNNKRDLGVEFAWNHLKYVVQDNQMMHLTGYIRGTYYDQDTLVTPGFVHFE